MLIGNDEQGFGLVELIVAMVIGTVVLSIFASMLSQGWVRSADADATSIASARITDALDRLGDDLRSARIAERADIFDTATKDELKVKLADDPVRYGDVAVARGQHLAFYTNGDGGAAPICVTWSFQLVDDGRTANVWALTRRTDANCTPGAAQGREVLATLPDGATPLVHSFRYGVLGAPNALGTCPTTVSSPGGGSLNANQRLRITTVHVDLATGAARGQAAARNRAGRDVLGLWSRLNDDYYFAVGCAQ